MPKRNGVKIICWFILSLIWDFLNEFRNRKLCYFNRTSRVLERKRVVRKFGRVTLAVLEQWNASRLRRNIAVTICEKHLTENNGLERVKHFFVRFICKTMSRFLDAWWFDREFWGERVKRIALLPLRLSAILFAFQFASRRYRCGFCVSIMLCLGFLNLHRDAERLISLICFIIIWQLQMEFKIVHG